MKSRLASSADGIFEFVGRDLPVDLINGPGPVRRIILIHDIYVGTRRHLVGEKLHDTLRTSQIIWKHQMPDQQATPGDTAFVQIQITDLTVHLKDRSPVYLGVIRGG